MTRTVVLLPQPKAVNAGDTITITLPASAVVTGYVINVPVTGRQAIIGLGIDEVRMQSFLRDILDHADRIRTNAEEYSLDVWRETLAELMCRAEEMYGYVTARVVPDTELGEEMEHTPLGITRAGIVETG